MDIDKLKFSFIPMSETAYYILLSLIEPRHGYGIMQHVEKLTAGRINLGAGTLYGSLSKMENAGLIEIVLEKDKRKVYKITSAGQIVLGCEIERIGELYENGRGYSNAAK